VPDRSGEIRLEEQLAETRTTAEARLERIRQLETALEVQRSDAPEETPAFQARLQAMQEELDQTRQRAEQDIEAALETSKARIAQLEAERDRMSATLAAKEKKLSAAMGQIEEVQDQAQKLASEMAQIHKLRAERDSLSSQLAAKEDELVTTSKLSHRVRELEAEITDLRDRAVTSSTPPPVQPAPAGSGSTLADPTRLAALYQQTMSRLTVIQASAELLAMNSRLDASSRDTAKDIRTESQLLSEIIKNFALPPDMRRAE
jgi:DNA repair exonuclease SbcCD ATPase subunit